MAPMRLHVLPLSPNDDLSCAHRMPGAMSSGTPGSLALRESPVHSTLQGGGLRSGSVKSNCANLRENCGKLRKIAGKLQENCGAVTNLPEPEPKRNTSAQGTHRAPTSTQRQAKSIAKVKKIAKNCKPPPLHTAGHFTPAPVFSCLRIQPRIRASLGSPHPPPHSTWIAVLPAHVRVGGVAPNAVTAVGVAAQVVHQPGVREHSTVGLVLVGRLGLPSLAGPSGLRPSRTAPIVRSVAGVGLVTRCRAEQRRHCSERQMRREVEEGGGGGDEVKPMAWADCAENTSMFRGQARACWGGGGCTIKAEAIKAGIGQCVSFSLLHCTGQWAGRSWGCNAPLWGAAGSANDSVYCHTAGGQWAVAKLQYTAALQCVVGSVNPSARRLTAWGSGQCKSFTALPLQWAV